LIAALFAILAALTVAASARRWRLPAAAVLVGLALVGAQFAAGAATYGTQPKLYPPCADRPSESAALAALDFVACRLHHSLAPFVADAAAAGAGAVDFLLRLIG